MADTHGDESETPPEPQPEIYGGGSGNRPRKTAVGSDDGNADPGWCSSSGHNATLYDLLQVEPTADFAVMTRVYRYLSAKYHSQSQQTAHEAMWRELVDAWGEKFGSKKRAAEEALTVETGQSETKTDTFYSRLQVKPWAETGVIFEAYSCLARKYHPDNKATGDPNKYRRLADAWLVLSSPTNRSVYDGMCGLSKVDTGL